MITGDEEGQMVQKTQLPLELIIGQMWKRRKKRVKKITQTAEIVVGLDISIEIHKKKKEPLKYGNIIF